MRGKPYVMVSLLTILLLLTLLKSPTAAAQMSGDGFVPEQAAQQDADMIHDVKTMEARLLDTSRSTVTPGPVATGVNKREIRRRYQNSAPKAKMGSVRVFARREEMCDACKTMVEEFHRRFHGIVQHVRKKNMSESELKVWVRNDWPNISNHSVNSLCDSERYKHFGGHIREGCKIMLLGNRQESILKILHNVLPIHVSEHGGHHDGRAYAPKHAVWRKRIICEDVFGVCPEIPPPVPLSKCRLCAEVFRDFHYITRRDAAPVHAIPGYKDPMSMRRKRIYSQMLDMCEDGHMRHSYSHANEVVEECHTLVRANSEAIQEVYLNASGEPGCPAQRICVNITRSCSLRRFRMVEGHLEHEHSWSKRQEIFDGVLAGAEFDEL